MKRLWLVFVGVFSIGSVAMAQTPDPVRVVKDITAYRAQKVKEARDSNTPIDANKLSQECIAKAQEALKGVDLTKVDPSKALDWARVTNLADRDKDTCDLCRKFLTTSPDPKMKYVAENLMLAACGKMGEGEMLAMMLPTVAPDTKQAAVTLAVITANSYVDLVKEKKGIDEALRVLDSVDKKVPYSEFTTDQEKVMADSARGSIASAKAELLMEQHKKADALAVLDGAMKLMTPDGAYAKRLNSSKTQYNLIGAPAPSMPSDKSHGEYLGLDAYKGKVVILDFFAHWCGPCIRSFPDMKALYEANKDKGLVMIGVTAYYGYYKDQNVKERDMPKDVEFGKMADFMKEHSMTWPVIYTDKTNYAPFGVSGIPHVVVIDRQGNVHKIKVGYSPDSFKAFKAEVEKLIKG